MASESETVRAEFEVFAARIGLDIKHILYKSTPPLRFHDYGNRDTSHAWHGFQAARSCAPSAEAKDGFVRVPREATPEMIAAIALASWNTASASDVAVAREALKTVMLHMQTAPGATLDDVAHSVATFVPAWRAAVAVAIAQQGAAAAQEVG